MPQICCDFICKLLQTMRLFMHLMENTEPLCCWVRLRAMEKCMENDALLKQCFTMDTVIGFRGRYTVRFVIDTDSDEHV
jgi:hypothetical protein